MTTYVQHPSSVSARIDTPAPTPATDVHAAYTVTVFMNADPLSSLRSFFGERGSAPLTEVTTADGSVLKLVFFAHTHADAHAAADAAYCVGNRQRLDDLGQDWPHEGARLVNVGDVMAVTGPDGTTVHLRVDGVGFSKTEPPAPAAATPRER